MVNCQNTKLDLVSTFQAEQERQAREKEEKEKREKIAEEKRLAEEEKKKAALAALNATTGSRPGFSSLII